MRLIDADALNKTLGFADPCANCKHVYGAFLCDDAIWQEVCDAISEAPTIDAVPVRRGKWIDKSGGIEGAWNHCSVCGERAIELYDYCPNCGAKMEDDNETD